MSCGRLADDVRPRHVGVALRLDVARPEVDHDRLARRDLSRPHVVPHRGLRAVRDDELVEGHAVPGEDLGYRRLDPLARERLAVHLQPRAVLGGAPQQIARRVHPALCRALRPPHPGELGLALHAPPVVKEVVLRGERHARLPQPVGEDRWEGRRHRRLRDAEVLARLDRDPDVDLLARQPLREQRVVAELLVRVRRRPARDRIHAVDLERGEDDVPLPAPSTYRNGSGIPIGTSCRIAGSIVPA